MFGYLYNLLINSTESFFGYINTNFPSVISFEHQYHFNFTHNYLLLSFFVYLIIYILYSHNQYFNKFLTRYIATPIHEIFHLIGAIVVSAKIYQVKLIASREEVEEGVLGYVKSGPPFSNSMPLGIFLGNLGIVTQILRFIFQPIISLAPILFGGILYIIALHFILGIPLINLSLLETTISALNFSWIQSLMLFLSTLIFLLTSIPSYGKNGNGDINGVKVQLFILLGLSLFITNPLFLQISKFFYVYLVSILFLQGSLFIINFIKKMLFR